MQKKDKLYISIYNDYYGGLLTPNQAELLRQYYDEDMSLSEIGDERGVSPQGVRDGLVRAEKALEDFEQKLGLVEKTTKATAILNELYSIADEGQKIKINEILSLLGK